MYQVLQIARQRLRVGLYFSPRNQADSWRVTQWHLQDPLGHIMFGQAILIWDFRHMFSLLIL